MEELGAARCLAVWNKADIAPIPASVSTFFGVPVLAVSSREGTGIDELCAAIGYGGTTATKAVARIKDELLRLGRLNEAKMNHGVVFLLICSLADTLKRMRLQNGSVSD